MRLFRLVCAFIAIQAFPATGALAETRSLSQAWLFHAGESQGAESPRFDDRGWRKVAIPHDWSIIDKPDGLPPFDAKATAGQDSGYLPGGIGWYRRHLNLTAAEAAKVVRLNFEAIYMGAEAGPIVVEVEADGLPIQRLRLDGQSDRGREGDGA